MNIIPNRQVQPNPAASEQLVRLWCEYADMTFAEPFTPDEVVTMVGAIGHACVLGTINEFIRKGYISSPPNNQWTSQFIHAFVAGLDCRRRWLPTPNQFHDSRKSGALLQVESAAQQGIDTFTDIEQYSLEDLVLQNTQAESREIRETLYLAIRRKMSELGFIEE